MAPQFDFGLLCQLLPLPGRFFCPLILLPLQSPVLQPLRVAGGSLRKIAVSGKIFPVPDLSNFSRLLSNISSYSSLPRIHFRPHALFNHPHKNQHTLFIFTKADSDVI